MLVKDRCRLEGGRCGVEGVAGDDAGLVIAEVFIESLSMAAGDGVECE